LTGAPPTAVIGKAWGKEESMSTSRIDWATVLGRLKQTVVELEYVNRSNISEIQRARRLAVADGVAAQLFETPVRTVGEPATKAMRALELVWEEGLDFHPNDRLDPIWNAIAEKDRRRDPA
jgi:hypothetical protein